MENRENPSGEIYYYGPLIEFDTNDPEFLRGAEYGATHERLRRERGEVVQQIMHRTNEEMVRRMAHANGREYSIEIVDEAFMMVTFDVPTKPNIMDALHPPQK